MPVHGTYNREGIQKKMDRSLDSRKTQWKEQITAEIGIAMSEFVDELQGMLSTMNMGQGIDEIVERLRGSFEVETTPRGFEVRLLNVQDLVLSEMPEVPGGESPWMVTLTEEEGGDSVAPISSSEMMLSEFVGEMFGSDRIEKLRRRIRSIIRQGA